MKNWLIILFLSFGIVACGGGGGGGGSSTPTDDGGTTQPTDPTDDDSDSGDGSGGDLEPTFFIDPDYNISSNKDVKYSFSNGSTDCDLVVYVVPYQENNNYTEDSKDILEELDQVENCSIVDRSATVLSTTTQLCISKNGSSCLIINL